MKVLVMITVTVLLQVLCMRGQTTIAWLIVFIPFIFMSVVVAILLYVFGLDAATGTIKIAGQQTPANVSTDASGNVLVYDPYYNPRVAPVYYNAPNVVVPKPPIAYEPDVVVVSTPEAVVPDTSTTATVPATTTTTTTAVVADTSTTTPPPPPPAT